MQRMKVFCFLCAVFPSQVASQAVCPATITDQISPAELVACVAELRKQPTSIPKGAILMTDKECAALGPSWVVYGAAGGRFPVAAGAAEDINGEKRQFVLGHEDAVGEYSHSLTKAELPKHSHSIDDPGHSHGVAGVTYANNGQGHYDQAGGASQPTTESKTGISITESGGNGAAHNNIPPFVTLNFCQFN